MKHILWYMACLAFYFPFASHPVPGGNARCEHSLSVDIEKQRGITHINFNISADVAEAEGLVC